MKYGLSNNGVSLFYGKLPNRKSDCFYFVEGTTLTPVAYVSSNLERDAREKWNKLTESTSDMPKEFIDGAGLYYNCPRGRTKDKGGFA